MKKWLGFLLLLLTTAGTFIPCCGVDDCCADRFPGTSNHDQQKNEGTCSPFFACATCPGFVQLSKPIQLVQPIVEKIVHHQVIITFNLPTYAPSFWQPPRSC